MLKLFMKAHIHLANLFRDHRGATAIEYGLIAAGIAIAIVGVLASVGNEVASLFETLQNSLAKTP